MLVRHCTPPKKGGIACLRRANSHFTIEIPKRLYIWKYTLQQFFARLRRAEFSMPLPLFFSPERFEWRFYFCPKSSEKLGGIFISVVNENVLIYVSRTIFFVFLWFFDRKPRKQLIFQKIAETKNTFGGKLVETQPARSSFLTQGADFGRRTSVTDVFSWSKVAKRETERESTYVTMYLYQRFFS